MNIEQFLLNKMGYLEKLKSIYGKALLDVSRYVMSSVVSFDGTPLVVSNRLLTGRVMPTSRDRFSSVAYKSAMTLANTLQSRLTPMGSNWARYNVIDDSKSSQEEKLFYQKASDLIMGELGSTSSGFNTHNFIMFKMLSSYHIGTMYTEMDERGNIYHCTIPVNETFVDTNQYNEFDTFCRVFMIPARLAAQKFLSIPGAKITEPLAESIRFHPEREFRFAHFVFPSEELRFLDSPEIFIDNNFPYVSFYFDLGTNTIISQKGYYTMPYTAARLDAEEGRIYPTGPSYAGMTDIKLLNIMEKSYIMAQEREADPVYGTTDDNAIDDNVKIIPGQVIKGAIDSGTNLRKIQRLTEPVQLNDILQGMERKAQQIRELYMSSSLQNQAGPAKTATETSAIIDENQRQTSSYQERIMHEYLNKFLNRMLDLFIRGGKLDPIPDSIKKKLFDRKALRVGQDYHIQYESPFAHIVKLDDAQSANKFLQMAGPWAQIKPEVLDEINGGRLGSYLRDAAGVNLGIVATDKEKAQAAQGRQQQLQQAQDAQKAQLGSKLLTQGPQGGGGQ